MVYLPLIPLVSVFGGLGVVGGIRGKKNDAVASERSIFKAKTVVKKVFSALQCVPIGTYISGSTCAWWQKTTNRHTPMHTRACTHTHNNYRNPLAQHTEG